MRYCSDTWLVQRKDLCCCSCAISSIMGTKKRQLWIAPMQHLKNGLGHQQVRVYLSEHWRLCCCCKIPSATSGDRGILIRSLITTVVVPVSHHDVIPGLHLLVDLLYSPTVILRSTTSSNLPRRSTRWSVSSHVLHITEHNKSILDFIKVITVLRGFSWWDIPQFEPRGQISKLLFNIPQGLLVALLFTDRSEYLSLREGIVIARE